MEPRQDGIVSLEMALALPLLALAVLAALQSLALVRDVLLAHEAARAGARAAATTLTTAPVRAAAGSAADGRPVRVTVSPARRRPGDLARVDVAIDHRIGSQVLRIRAGAAARVEPGAGRRW